MGNKLFVGGLSWGTTDDGLKEAFSRFGSVTEAKVILDRETGRSRGFGFVSFSEEEAAQKAIEGMNGSVLDGRNLKVNEAQERPRGPRDSGPRGPRFENRDGGPPREYRGGGGGFRGGDRPPRDSDRGAGPSAGPGGFRDNRSGGGYRDSGPPGGFRDGGRETRDGGGKSSRGSGRGDDPRESRRHRDDNEGAGRGRRGDGGRDKNRHPGAGVAGRRSGGDFDDIDDDNW